MQIFFVTFLYKCHLLVLLEKIKNLLKKFTLFFSKTVIIEIVKTHRFY